MYVRLVSASKFKWNDLENCQGWRCARKLVYGEAVAQDLALIRQMEPVGVAGGRSWTTWTASSSGRCPAWQMAQQCSGVPG